MFVPVTAAKEVEGDSDEYRASSHFRTILLKF